MKARKSHRLLSNAAITTLLTLVNIAVGIIFQALVADRLGTSATADVFAAGTALPTVLATAIIGSVPLVLVPAIAACRRVGSSLPRGTTTRAGAVLVGLSFLTLVAAPLLAHLTAAGFSGRKLAATASFLRITSPVPLLAGIAALGQAKAYADERYVRAGAAAAINGVGLLAVTLLTTSGSLSADALAWAVLSGYVVQSVWMVPELLGFVQRGNGNSTQVDTVSALTATLFTLIAASLVYKGQPVIERTIASSIAPGAAAIMGYALKIVTGLTALSSGLATVAMPRFSHTFARSNHDEAARTLEVVLSSTLTICVVICAYTLLAAPEIVRILFGRGDLNIRAEHEVTTVVLIYLLLVVSLSLAGPIVGVHYARGRQRWVSLVGILGLVCGISSSLSLSWMFGVGGVALGTGIGSLVPLAVFAAALPRQLQRWRWSDFVRLHARRIAATLSGVGLALVAWHLLQIAPAARGDFAALAVHLVAKAGILILGVLICAVVCRCSPQEMLLGRQEGRGISA